MPEESRRRLTSWKEIAQHLDRDVRSVMRWEKERGLPVHRVAGGKTGRVWAYVDELDAWFADGPPAEEQPAPALEGEPVVVEPAPGAAVAETHSPDGRRHRYTTWAGLAACAVTLAGAAVLLAKKDPIHTVLLEGRELRATTRSGRVLWTHTMTAANEVAPAHGSWQRIADLDGDGRPEVLVVLSHKTAERLGVNTLYCFDDTGQLRWQHTPQDRLQFGSGEYTAPWSSWNLFVVQTLKGPRVVWPLHHHTWWPSILMLFDATGTRQTAFIHAGWIVNAAASNDGRRLFVTGSTNARDAYFLGVLDVERSGAVLPEDPSSPFACRGCPDARPVHYYVFPRTEASRLSQFPDRRPGVQAIDAAHLQVQVHESGDPISPATIYEFDATGERLLRASYIDSYWLWHRDQERAGRIAHTADRCPERSSLNVAHWSERGGWTTRRMPQGISVSALSQH